VGVGEVGGTAWMSVTHTLAMWTKHDKRVEAKYCTTGISCKRCGIVGEYVEWVEGRGNLCTKCYSEFCRVGEWWELTRLVTEATDGLSPD
jgi:hypothetical protein